MKQILHLKYYYKKQLWNADWFWIHLIWRRYYPCKQNIQPPKYSKGNGFRNAYELKKQPEMISKRVWGEYRLGRTSLYLGEMPGTAFEKKAESDFRVAHSKSLYMC